MILRLLITSLCLLGLMSRVVLAQSAPSASVNAPDEAYVGDAMPFNIVIQNASRTRPIDLAALVGNDWEVAYRGETPSSSSFTISINGRVQEQTSHSVTLSYFLTPRREGELAIPAIQLEADGKPVRTRPVTVRVQQPTEVDGLGSTIDADKAFVGQTLTLSLSWVLSTTAEDPTFNLNLPDGAFDIHPIQPAASAGAPQRRFVEVAYIGGPGGERGTARGEASQVSIDGENRSKFTLSFIIIPRRAGKFSIGDARVDFRGVIGQRERSLFDAPWDRKTITQRRFSRAESKSIQVLDLPAAGRPANFSGLVGEFALTAECQPRQAAVGDPLDFTLALRSKLPFIDAPTLDLSRQRSGSGTLADGFRVPRDPVLPQLAETVAVYSAQIRPRSTKVTELPPVELWYFDPTMPGYRLAQSNRIPLKVVAAPAVGLGGLERLEDDDESGAIESDDSPKTTATAGSLPPKVDGLYPPLGTSVASLSAESALSPVQMVQIGATVIAIPGVLWFAGMCLAVRRRAADRDPAAWRRRGALFRTERALRRSSGDPAAVSAAFRAFVADWFTLSPEAVTSGDAADAIEGVHPVLASRARALLAQCDQTLFGPDRTMSAPTNAATEAASIAREIARFPAAATGGAA